MLNFRSLVPFGQENYRPPVSRESGGDPFFTFRRGVDRLFDDFFRTEFPTIRGDDGNGWFSVTPQIDMRETDKEIVVTAELPGVEEKELDVSLMGDILTVKGEKKYEHEEKNDNRFYHERRFGSFSRSVQLPFEAGDENVDAKMKNGVLTIKIPKPADYQNSAKRIEIHSE
jgi:HSP20 family protein